MKFADDIKRVFKNASVGTNPKTDDAILNQLIQTHKQAADEKHIGSELNIWRIIMKSKITKLAAAAAIVIAAVFSVYIIDRSLPAAFGIEQVINAYNDIRFLYIKQFYPEQEQPNEFWIKSDEQGRVVKARYYLPETEDGVKLITWTPERAEVWFKSKHGFRILQTNRIEDWMQSLMEKCQPKLVMQELLEGQKAGKVDIDIQKPQVKQEPALIVVTYKTEPEKEIYYINQATDLITHIEYYSIENDREILRSTMEFYDYNVPIDEDMFSLEDEIPEDIWIADQLNQLIGVPQGDMTDEQAAEETVRQFYQALIDKDYKKAGLILAGMLEEHAKEEFGGMNVISIVSVGPAIPQPDWVKRGFRVPCELEIIKSNGQKVACKAGPYVRPGDDEAHPDRWNITGGMNIIEILPDSEKYEKMTPKEAAEAFFKACAEKDWDEFAKLCPELSDERMKQIIEQMKEYLGGLEIISIGESFKEGDYPGWFVPYEIKLPPMEFNLKLSNANSAGRFVITGVYDSKLQRAKEEIKWSNEPEILPDNDKYATMSPDDAAKAFAEAFSRQDWDEVRKFVPESSVKDLKELAESNQTGGGMEVTGEALWSEEHSAYFVKCQIKGLIKKWNLAIRNDNEAHRWQFDGGI